ncbi:amidohydrolase family protein [Vibrio sp. PP-XX7]
MLRSPNFLTAAAIASKNANAYLDASSLADGDTSKFSIKDVTLLISEPIDKILQYIGNSDKLIFGSGWPMVHMESYIESFIKYITHEEDQCKILHNNALKLLNINDL